MRKGVFLGLSLGLLFPSLDAQEKQEEPGAGELLKQGLVNINLQHRPDRLCQETRTRQVHPGWPGGQGPPFFYRIYKPVSAEELEIKVLDDVHPFSVKYLAEKGVEYREEETTIKGTGAYVKQGAPAFPSLLATAAVLRRALIQSLELMGIGAPSVM